MAKQNLGPVMDPMASPATPLSNYSPGALARMTPEQRAKALKQSKKVKLTPAMLTSPTTPLT